MSETQTLAITALGHRGEGVARTGNGVVYVPLTLPGETVAARVDGTRGQLETILVPSADRARPACPHFGTCGGCQLQHMAAPAYRAWKRGRVVEALERAGIDAEVKDLADVHGTGRRRATLHAQKGAAGFMALRTNTIASIDTCPILVPALARAPEIARAIAAVIGPCDVSFTASDFGLDVAVRAKGARMRPELAPLAVRFDLARLAINGEVVLAYRNPAVRMGPANVSLPVESFLQATTAAETRLGALVVEAAKGSKRVADLFCGMGPFALRLAQLAPVFAADSSAPAIAALTAAVRQATGLKAVTAQRRDLFREPLTTHELKSYDTVVIDPPRAGAQAQMHELAQSRVRTVISVSCDPQTFARDAAILVSGGYRIGPVTPLDQFAHSAHVELFAVFTRAKA